MAGGIFALDLSSRIGWCLADRGCRPIYGFWQLPKIGGEGARFASAENEIAQALLVHQPHVVVVEAPLPLPALNNRESAFQQIGLRAIAYSEGWRASTKVFEVDAYTVRKEMLGTGRSSKDENIKTKVLRYCHERGWSVVDDNVGDALLLAAFYASAIGWRMATGPKVTT